jgi:hypothetical protein
MLTYGPFPTMQREKENMYTEDINTRNNPQ